MFEFVNALEVDAAARVARGRATVQASHPLFADHFPGRALLPGSIAIEIAAQIAGPLAEAVSGDGRLAFLGIVRNAKLHDATPLPAELAISARIVSLAEVSAEAPRPCTAMAVIARGDDKIATAELIFVLLHRDGPAEALVARAQRVQRWKDAW